MSYLNKNKSLYQIQDLLTKNKHQTIQQPDQHDLFQKKTFLENIIEECITFNRVLIWDHSIENVHLATSAEALVKIFQLRSTIYTALHYNDEFPDLLKGLNFDTYDQNAAILYTTDNHEITGTCRVIFDSSQKLPTEHKVSFDQIRAKYQNIVEVSRLMVNTDKKGLNLEFKNLTQGTYHLLKNNSIDLSLSVIKAEHFKLYSKFGGFQIEESLNAYGHLENAFVITSWDPTLVSKFFQRAFLQ
ncbi:MAG: GNAT family N-acetyltransferase [Epsilonproteobacteria bacterium]|nr:GNAT family N-acetyltransferase [Campylobacterota bacterium]